MLTPIAPVRAEILMIGTELLLGQVQDTNATYMGQTLASHGIHLYQKTTVGDNSARICAALELALSRSDVVLCSGGLGPTEDDITRECVAKVLGRKMVYRAALFEAIRARFARFRRTITANNKKQAMLPEGAEAIDNPYGTAPGVLAADRRGTIICMPGVPSELKPMLEERVLPYLRERFGLAGVLHYRVLKVAGVGESRIDSMIGDIIQAQENPTVGLLASPDVVRVRIAAYAESVEAAQALIAPVEAQLRSRLGGLVYGADADVLEGVVNRLLHERGWTLAVAETQSGGMLAQRLVAADADRFVGARIVPGKRGASPEDAIDLAHEIMVSCNTHCAIALLADSVEERSWGALVTPEARAVREIGYAGGRGRNQLRTAVVALEHFRRLLAGELEGAHMR
ncbi:MAG: CinA family nicotinamide mononucleotide deamidase-related protein [Candidatus Hydrogenedentota bacterium]